MSMTTITLAGIMLLYFLYLSLWPINVVKLNNSPLEVNAKQYNPGDTVIIKVDFIKLKDYKPSVKYYLLCNGYNELLTQDGVNRPVQRNIVTVYKIIPREIKPTTNCYIQIDLSYEITPFRFINYSWQTKQFDIISGN